MVSGREAGSPTRVCVIGGGAAGISAAWSLGRFPEKFSVELWEKAPVVGGVATSETVDGGSSINDGVQGGAESYRNTIQLMALFGYEPSWLEMKVSFGQGDKEWNNYVDTPIMERHRDEIKRFGQVLKRVSSFEAYYVFVTIERLLQRNKFSKEFCNDIVFPLTALFFGTGNQTPNVSSVIFARVFNDPDLRLYTYDPKSFLSAAPRMFAFPNFGEMYSKMAAEMNAKVHCNRAVKTVKREGRRVIICDDQENQVEFDEVVFACDAETVLKILEKPRWMERKVLGNVRYYDDISITHVDKEYMKKNFNLHDDRNEMYFVRTYQDDPRKIEMAFDLSHYQPWLLGKGQNIYQTIYMNQKEDGELWTIDEIDESKILLRKWWRQFGHVWQHFVYTVPFIRFLQGRQNSWFCGSYTLVNTHEIAIISGLAVAERLGAPYPFQDDKLALKQFETYLRIIHGHTRRSKA